MEQNRNIPLDFLVFEKLIKNKCHLRELARKTKINPMSVKRIADKLIKKNILDFTVEGKNKIFFIKNNFESKTFKIIYEEYLKLECIQNNASLRKIFEKISQKQEIKLALLFGSYAKGLADKNSDIDIFIETQSLKLKKEIELIDSRISLKIGKLSKNDFLTREIIENHIIIKGAEYYHEI